MEGILSVKILGSSGKEGKGENQFAQPRGVCVNHATKELFVVDCNNHRIQVFHLPSLAFIRQIGRGVQSSGPGGFMYPVGICMDDTNQVFIADTNNHRVVVYNHLTGTYLRSIGSHGATVGYFNCPYGVCVDRTAGVLYVADYENNRVQVFDKDTGAIVRVIGNGHGNAPGQFNQPIDVCVDEENHYLLVADYSNNRVQVFNKTTGIFERFVGELSGPNAFSGPRAICLNKEVGLLFISDRENHRIQMFHKNTFEFIRFIGNNIGMGLGQFNRPMELCCDNEEGVLIVVDGYNHRVQIIEIPELQVERQRLKNAKRSEDSAITSIPTIVRPSRQVISMLTRSVSAFAHTKKVDGSLWYHFEKLGAVYDNIVMNQNIARDECTDGNCTGGEMCTFNPFPETDHLLKAQGNLFLKMLDELVPVASESGSLLLLAPTIVGMQALLQKGWVPTVVSVQIIVGLFGILQDKILCANVPGHSQVIHSIVQLLRSTIVNSDQARQHIFQHLITAYKSETVYSNELLTEHGDSKGFSHILILNAYFDILETFMVKKGVNLAHPGSSSSSAVSSTISMQNSDMGKGRSHNFVSMTNEQSHFIMYSIFGVQLSQFMLDFTKSLETPKLGAVALSHGLSKDGCKHQTVVLSSTLAILFERWLEVETCRNAVHSTYSDYQQSRRRFLSSYLDHAKHLDSRQDLLGKHRERRSRGGRNVWDGSSALQIGDLVDCMDREKVWFESIIVDALSDGSVKVHFMGWGAKWDDMIGVTEIPLRIATLNSKTVNWRSELFEGGLIEIKCNDDMVNQKWMWGRIMKLNLDEDWVEIAYSFSTEPLVVKRAWLFGETICPVGMHTKDKSKNAASAITKPGKKVEQILKEKLASSSLAEEVLFYDFEDDYLEIDELVSNDTSNMEGYFVKLKAAMNCDSSLFTVPQAAFISVGREVVVSIGDYVNQQSAVKHSVEDTQQICDILAYIYKATSPKLFLECIIKPIYFQAGFQAKVLSSSISACGQTHDWKWEEVLQLSDKLTALIAAYQSICTTLFSTLFSHSTFNFIGERIRSTINRCGFTPIANQIIQSCAQSPQLLMQAIQPLLSLERFHRNSIQSRKLIRLIFSSASSQEVKLLLDLIENQFIRRDCNSLLANATSGIDGGAAVESMLLAFDAMCQHFSKHTMDHHRLLCAVERILMEQTLTLSESSSKHIATSMAAFINSCLSKYNFTSAIEEDHSDEFQLPLPHLEKLASVAKILNMNEELRHHFVERYSDLLALRLVSGNYVSLAVERKAMFDFDVESASTLLDDFNRSGKIMDSFSSHLLERIDSCDGLTQSSFHSFVKCGGSFSVLVGNIQHWKTVVNSVSILSTLRLPPLLQDARNEFEMFYRGLSPKDSEEEMHSSRKLYWCLGLGNVSVDCFIRNMKVACFVMNEPQYCVLSYLSSRASKSITIGDLSLSLDLPVEVVSDIVTSLVDCSLLFFKDNNRRNHEGTVTERGLSGSSEVAIDEVRIREHYAYSFQRADTIPTKPLHGHFLQKCRGQLTDRSTDWRVCKLDAQVVRLMKRHSAMPSNGSKTLNMEQIVNGVMQQLRNLFPQVLFQECEVEKSCNRLVEQGVLYKDANYTTVLYSYLPSVIPAKSDDTSTKIAVASNRTLQHIISKATNSIADNKHDSAISESKEEFARNLESSCDQLLLFIASAQELPEACSLSASREDFMKHQHQLASSLVVFVSAVVLQLHYLLAENNDGFLGSLEAYLLKVKALAKHPSRDLLNCVSLFIFSRLPQDVVDSMLTVFVSMIDKKGVDPKVNSTLQHVLMHGVEFVSWSQLLALWTYSFAPRESVESKFADNESQPSEGNLSLMKTFVSSISITEVPASKVKVGVRSLKDKGAKEKTDAPLVCSTATPTFTLNSLLHKACEQCASFVGVSGKAVDSEGYSIDDLNFLVDATFSFMLQDSESSIGQCIWWWESHQGSFHDMMQQAMRLASSHSHVVSHAQQHAVSASSTWRDNEDLFANVDVQYRAALESTSKLMDLNTLNTSIMLEVGRWNIAHMLDSWFCSQPLLLYPSSFKCSSPGHLLPSLRIVCPSCHEQRSIDDVVYGSRCSHVACRDCWKTHVNSQRLATGNVHAVPCIHNNQSGTFTCSSWLSWEMMECCLGTDSLEASLQMMQSHNAMFLGATQLQHSSTSGPSCSPWNHHKAEKGCAYCWNYRPLSVLSKHSDRMFQYVHGGNAKSLEALQSTLESLRHELTNCKQKEAVASIFLKMQFWEQILDCERLLDHSQKLLALAEEPTKSMQLMRWQESYLDFPKVQEPTVEELHQVRRLHSQLCDYYFSLLNSLEPECTGQPPLCAMDDAAIHRNSSSLLHVGRFGELTPIYLKPIMSPCADLPVFPHSGNVMLTNIKQNLKTLRQLEHLPREDIILKMKEMLDALDVLHTQDPKDFVMYGLGSSNFVLVDVVTVAEALEYFVSDPDSFMIMLAVVKAFVELLLRSTYHHNPVYIAKDISDGLERASLSFQRTICNSIELYSSSKLNIVYNSLKVFHSFLKLGEKLYKLKQDGSLFTLTTVDERLPQVLSQRLGDYRSWVDAAKEGESIERIEEVLECCKTIAQTMSLLHCVHSTWRTLLEESLMVTLLLNKKTLVVPERSWEMAFGHCLHAFLNHGKLVVDDHCQHLFLSIVKILKRLASHSNAKKDSSTWLGHDHSRKQFELVCTCVSTMSEAFHSGISMASESLGEYYEVVMHLLEWRWSSNVHSKSTPSTFCHVVAVIAGLCDHLTEESKGKMKVDALFEKLRYLREEIKLLFKESTSRWKRLQYHWCQFYIEESMEAINKLRPVKPRIREPSSPVRSPPPTRASPFPPTAANENQMLNILFNEVLARRRNVGRPQDGNHDDDENQMPMRTLLGQLLDYSNAVHNIAETEREMHALHPMQLPMAAMMLLRRENEGREEMDLRGRTIAQPGRLRDSDDDSSDDHHSQSDSSESSSNDSEDF